ncbi:MAG: hypothetical protein ACREJ3_10685, partial [Polyangiaceae bacterium]
MVPILAEGSLEPEMSGGLSAAQTASCPGCGESVDPLRAGHVAILAGRGFCYFCRAACKDEYLRALGRSPEDDVATASPPEAVLVDDAVEERVPGLPSSSELTPAPEGEGDSRGEEPGTRTEPLESPAPMIGSPPSQVRSDRLRALIAAIGIIAGALVPAIGLFALRGDVARVPLVLAAWVVLAVRIERAPRDPADAHPLVVLAPVTGAVIAALWARLVADPHAIEIEVFAGIACAGSLLVEVVVAGARGSVEVARAQVARALDVSARVIHGLD